MVQGGAATEPSPAAEPAREANSTGRSTSVQKSNVQSLAPERVGACSWATRLHPCHLVDFEEDKPEIT